MIYFIQQGAEGPIKVGFSQTRRGVMGRLRAMQTAHAVRLRLLGVGPGDLEDERLLHEWLADSRVRGEWFTPSEELSVLARSDAYRDEILEFLWSFSRSFSRWQRAGFIDVAGKLTDEGSSYFRTIERFVLLGQQRDLSFD